MPKLSQKGAIHLLLPLLLIGGIIVTVWLVTNGNPLKLFSKASLGTSISFVDSSGKTITQTAINTVKVKLTAPDWPQVAASPTTDPLTNGQVGYWKDLASYNGTNQATVLDSTPALSPNKVTVSAWVNIKSYTNNYPRIISKMGSYELIAYGYKGGQGQLQWKINNPQEKNTTSGITAATLKDRLKLNTWYHLAATYDGNTSKIYVNGAKVAEKTNIPGSLTSTNNPLAIGAEVAKTNKGNITQWPINADIKEVRVYNRALADTEISQLYSSPTPTSSPTPQAVTTKTIVLAEDPNFNTNKQTLDFTTNPISYSFSNSSTGTKTLYAKFISSDNREQNANPFPATISLVSPSVSSPVTSSTPSPTPTPTVPTLTVSPTSTTKFGTVTITWSGITNPNKYDFITSLPASFPAIYIYSTDGKCSVGGAAANANPQSNGSCTLNLSSLYLNGGNYTLELYSGNPSTFGKKLATSSSFTIDSFKGVFVTNGNYQGNLGGISGADAKCQASAQAAGLTGTWKAWLSDSQHNVRAFINPFMIYPYKTLEGKTVVANAWSDLTSGVLKSPINVTELKTTLDSRFRWAVWTGTLADGSKSSTSQTQTCSDWTSSNVEDGYGHSNFGGVGSAASTDGKWTNDTTNTVSTNCPNWNKLYCFEQ